MQTTKPTKLKIDRVAIRKKIAKEFANGNFSKLDLLCPTLDEFRYNWEESYYKSSPSFETICLYVLYLEERINILSNIANKLIAETSEEDNLGIGDI